MADFVDRLRIIIAILSWPELEAMIRQFDNMTLNDESDNRTWEERSQ
jgi:hypothetical protein